jgi:hypothetical protein
MKMLILFGLALDIAGGLLMYYYGLSNLDLILAQTRTVFGDPPSPQMQAQLAHYRTLANIGFWTFLAGFVFQFMGNLVVLIKDR